MASPHTEVGVETREIRFEIVAIHTLDLKLCVIIIIFLNFELLSFAPVSAIFILPAGGSLPSQRLWFRIGEGRGCDI